MMRRYYLVQQGREAAGRNGNGVFARFYHANASFRLLGAYPRALAKDYPLEESCNSSKFNDFDPFLSAGTFMCRTMFTIMSRFGSRVGIYVSQKPFY